MARTRRKIQSPFDPDYLVKYEDDQPRDDSGRWTSTGGGGSTAAATAEGERRRGGVSEAYATYRQPTREIMERAKERDEPVTQDVKGIIEGGGGSMIGLDNRLKTKADRIAQKMDENAREANLTPEQARETIYDSLRYTGSFPTESYANGVEKTIASLRAKGYEIYDKKDKNFWPPPPGVYRGLNFVFQDPTGHKFEVQFHTEESYGTVKKNHDLYKEFRKEGTTAERRKQLWDGMNAAWSSVPIPSGVQRLGRPVAQPRPQ